MQIKGNVWLQIYIYICVCVCCNATDEADRFPTSADGSFKSSEGLPTPETYPLRPPKPPRTKIRQYSWRNSSNTHAKTLRN